MRKKDKLSKSHKMGNDGYTAKAIAIVMKQLEFEELNDGYEMS